MPATRFHPRLLLALGGLAILALALAVGAQFRSRDLGARTAASPGGGSASAPSPRLQGRVAEPEAVEPGRGAPPAATDGEEGPRLRIAGRVLTAEGTPAPGATLGISPEADPPAPAGLHPAQEPAFPETQTDGDGRFVFEGLSPGRYRIRLFSARGGHGAQVREHVAAGSEDLVFVVPESERVFDVSIRIRVVGADGVPVPRARVRIWGGESSLSMPVQGGQDTPIAIDDVCAPVRLLVWDAFDARDDPLGYGPVLLEDVRTQADTIVIVMPPGEEVSGRVVWDGQPTSWALEASTYLGPDGQWSEEWADGALPAVRRHAQTDTDGRFRFRGLPRGTARIGLRDPQAPGRLQGGGAVVDVPSTGVELVAVPTGRLRILVRAPPGERLEGAEVRVEQWIEGGVRTVFSAQASTGRKSQGPPELAFDAGGLDLDGRYRIVVHGSFGGRGGGPGVVDGAVPRAEPYVLELAPGSRIAGRVVDATGRPLVGVVVHPRLPPGGDFFPYEANPAGLRVGYSTTDAGGHFALNVPPGGPYLLALESDSWAVLGHPPRAEAGAEEVRIVAEPARRITGRVVGAEGTPAGGFQVTGVPAGGVPSLWTRERVAADGFFEVPVGAGRHRVLVWNAEDPNDLRYALSDPVEAGAAGLRLVLGPGGALLGRLLDRFGRPVGGAHAWVLGPHVNRRATTDAAGAFGVHGIPAGRYQVFVRTPDGGQHTLPAAVTATGEPTVLDLRLPP